MSLIARKHVRRCSAQAAPVTASGGGNKQAGAASVKYDCPWCLSWLDNDPGNDTGSRGDGEGRGGVMAGPGGQHVKLGCYK